MRCDWLITLTQPCDWLSTPNVVPRAQRSLSRSWPPVPRLNLEKRSETRGYNDIDGILLVEVGVINLINKSHYISFHLIRVFLAQWESLVEISPSSSPVHSVLSRCRRFHHRFHVPSCRSALLLPPRSNQTRWTADQDHAKKKNKQLSGGEQQLKYLKCAAKV